MNPSKPQQDLEDQIFSRINSYKNKNPKKSLIAAFQEGASKNASTILQTQKQESTPQQPFTPDQNFEAEVLAKFDEMLMFKIRSIQNVLTSIQDKVNVMEPKLQVEVNNNQILSKIQNTITQSLNQSISGIKNSISMSINYYNNQLCQRQKKFNTEHEQTARVAIQNHKNVVNLKGKKGQMDFIRLQQRIRMLIRSQNKCQDMLLNIDRGLTKISQNIKDFNQGFMLDPNYKALYNEELVEVSEQQILQMILQKYDISMQTPQMRQFIYSQMGIKNIKKI